MYVNQNTKYAISIKWNYMDFRAMKYVQKQEDDVGCTHTVTFLATALNICDQGHGRGVVLGIGDFEGSQAKSWAIVHLPIFQPDGSNIGICEKLPPHLIFFGQMEDS